MRRVKPKVFLIGESQVDNTGFKEYCDHIGTSWTPEDSPTSSELLVEIMGRLCYRSWEVGMNPNVKRIREGNDKYIANIIKVKHGSVLEHPVTHWIFADVSRVFTHELVRHRAGMAYSQESLRFVRLEDLGLWLPPEIEAEPEVAKLFEQTFENLGNLQKELARVLKLDEIKDFSIKKKFTSAMRRVAPIGLATTIGVTANFRALRHILEMRTSGGAEAEIREVMGQVGEICKDRWANLFHDFVKNEKGEWIPGSSKV